MNLPLKSLSSSSKLGSNAYLGVTHTIVKRRTPFLAVLPGQKCTKKIWGILPVHFWVRKCGNPTEIQLRRKMESIKKCANVPALIVKK